MERKLWSRRQGADIAWQRPERFLKDLGKEYQAEEPQGRAELVRLDNTLANKLSGRRWVAG
jgi:hypothetical protein